MDVSDQLEVVDLALAQLPDDVTPDQVVIRADQFRLHQTDGRGSRRARCRDSTSGGGSVVLVEKAVEAVAALDGATARLIRWVWRSQLKPAMWALVMVVLKRVDEYTAEVALVGDHQREADRGMGSPRELVAR